MNATNAGTPLAPEYVSVYTSPEPDEIFAYSPGLCRLPSGRLIATCDLGGPGVGRLNGPKGEYRECSPLWQGRVFVSDDHGATWRHTHSFPFFHARPFVAGDALHVLGHLGDLTIIKSTDDGETWSEPACLTGGEKWHQAPCNVHYANGCVYLVMERRVRDEIQAWCVGDLAPVLMRGRVEADLMACENWTFASELGFHEVLDDASLDMTGIPFWPSAYPHGFEVSPGRNCAPIGWLEANVVQFNDPRHTWHDPTGRTFHLWSRAHTGGTGYACIAKVVEDVPGEGKMTTMLETVPSGKKVLYVPCPGGHMKFHVLYDGVTELYWLLSTQAIDSMTKPELLPPDRYNLPNNERRRLQLHFSKNMIDWCFAGIVAVGESDRSARNYASMVIDGDDLQILSRTGDEQAASAHNGNVISFHSVQDFRQLVY